MESETSVNIAQSGGREVLALKLRRGDQNEHEYEIHLPQASSQGQWRAGCELQLYGPLGRALAQSQGNAGAAPLGGRAGGSRYVQPGLGTISIQGSSTPGWP